MAPTRRTDTIPGSEHAGSIKFFICKDFDLLYDKHLNPITHSLLNTDTMSQYEGFKVPDYTPAPGPSDKEFKKLWDQTGQNLLGQDHQDHENLKDRLDSAIKRISALEKFIYTLYSTVRELLTDPDLAEALSDEYNHYLID
jgi:hypothetical protein